MKMNKLFLTVFLSFSAIQTNSFAQDKNTVLLDVNELQKLVDLYAGSDSFPLSFWEEENVTIQGSLVKNQYGAECLAPLIRLPQKNIQEDQTPRIILHLFCKGRSTIEYGKLDIPCKYTKRSEIPASMHAGEDPSECIQIKISMRPQIRKTSSGSEFGFEEILVERLLLFPKKSGESIHQAFLPVEEMFIEKMNESLKLVSSAWAKSSFSTLLELKQELSISEKSTKKVKLSLKDESFSIPSGQSNFLKIDFIIQAEVTE